ncbi:hypothetical protein H1Q58_16345 (plasmid) [Planococcus maritimus]|uniref:Uncharacterized protein n=1 Tax=Planococcus maritimus TaxID=192421 RepID=A0A7D7QX84_PLAMR|nr:hypothetical protein [Planococcus maritimus]QMT19154.1 hypothetical protein H1Q58_16345 [Planococcus maritimus]
MSNYKEYEGMLSKNSDEAVAFLLQKYGPAQDDYFRERSYRRFMDGEIKSIQKGKHSRTSEGLFCHHIDENKSLNLSNFSFIKVNKIPFESQKKDRLVYCDLIEHAVLHALIAQETSKKLGFPGYMMYLIPKIEEWYLDEIIPASPWEKNCYNKSFLIPEETVNIIKKMQGKLDLPYCNTISDYYEHKKRVARRLEYGKLAMARERKRKELEQTEKYKEIEREREIEFQKKSMEEFYRTYPNFNNTDIHLGTPRRKLIAMLYDYKYKNIYKSKKELDLSMKPIMSNKILEELHSVIFNVEDDER